MFSWHHGIAHRIRWHRRNFLGFGLTSPTTRRARRLSGGAEMWRLKAYRSGRPGVADLLPWATLCDSGLVATKKGALLAGYYFRPPDAASGTDEQAEHISAR